VRRASQRGGRADPVEAVSSSRRFRFAQGVLLSVSFVVVEFDREQFIDSGFAERLIFNERLAGFIKWTFTTGWRWDARQ
jgi:hypothetical protein